MTNASVDFAMVHRVVVACFLRKIHRLGFEDAREHGERPFGAHGKSCFRKRLPNGFQALLDVVHRRGLVFLVLSARQYEYLRFARAASMSLVRRSPSPRIVKVVASLTSFRWTP